jgi:plastocyanin domain-containing protein
MARKKDNVFEPIIRTSAVIGIIVVAAMFFSRSKLQTQTQNALPAPLAVNGTQVLDIAAKGGYSPRQIIAKAGVPSILKVSTQSTFDCSSALTIPALNYRDYLPPTGITEIPIPPQKPGTVITGLCSMGMYSFRIKFQ